MDTKSTQNLLAGQRCIGRELNDPDVHGTELLPSNSVPCLAGISPFSKGVILFSDCFSAALEGYNTVALFTGDYAF
ncbi:hypothetical protein [Endozoicomonas sp. ALE010]|uniref:hypothetical protein n=1 Tax=Endozoicomonas sp. ALE010 TaxID=3403081 RepID=UPI003BB64B93